MPASTLAAFWLLSLLLIAVPGADWAFILAAGLHARRVAPAVAGLAAGYSALTALVAAGVGALVAGSAPAMTALAVTGGAYLMWHGTRTALAAQSTDPDPAADAATDASAGTGTDQAGADRAGANRAGTDQAGRVAAGWWPLFRQGVGVSGLNPKGLLLFLALLPQFADPARAWPLWLQLAALGLAFTLTCVAFYLVLGSLARTLLVAHPGAAAWSTRVAGLAMLGLGAALLVERLTA
jgi:threonine/homoserine/homoserine lactone efflux protein